MLSEKIERKLDYFSNIMNHKVEKQRQRTRYEIEHALQLTATKTIEKAERRNKILQKTRQREIEYDINRQIAQAKLHALTQFTQIRKHQVGELLSSVQAQLLLFTQSDEYEKYIVDSVLKTQDIYTIIKLSPHDMRLGAKIKSATARVVETGESGYIGGFMLLNSTRTVQVDYTFKTRLEKAMEEFSYGTA